MLSNDTPQESITLTVFGPGEKSKGKPMVTTWSEFFAALSAREKTAKTTDKLMLPSWCPATFADHRRKLINVEQVFGTVLDFDNAIIVNGKKVMLERPVTIEAALSAWPDHFAFIYTSWSHAVEWPRFRLVLPYSRPITREEQDFLWEWVARRLTEAGQLIDTACKDASRLWFLPARRDETFEAVTQEGKPIDVDAVLAEVASRGEQNVKLQSDEMSHKVPRDKRIARARKYLAKVPPAVSGAGGHDATFKAAIALVRGFALPQDTALDLLKTDYNPRCQPPWTDAELLHKVEDAAKADGEVGLLLHRRGAGVEHEQDTNGDDRPQIVVSTKQEEVNDAAVAALGNAHPDIYQRGLRLVRVLRGDGDPLVQVAEATLREKLASAASWVHATQNGLMPAHPPGWSVKAVFERRQWSGVRQLRGVVGTPVLRPDGSILSTPGYDAATGLLYIPSCEFGEIPDQPSRQDALRARDELLDVVCDFPFETDAHKASWLAGTLTPLAIHAIEGPTPMVVVDGNVRGAGKGLLVDCAATIVTGKPFPKMAHVKNDEELEKRITSLGLAGVQACLVDNVRGFFGGAVWELVLTTRHWRGRILSKSEIVDLVLDIVWWVTGNNVEIGGDMGRRVIHVRLASPEERPEDRTGFKHPTLIAWIKQERPRLVRAALTILRAYIVAGRPAQAGVNLGSFEDWASLVASAVVWVELPDPCKTREGLEARADSDELRVGALLDAWVASFGTEGRTAAEVLRLIEAEDRRTAKPAYTGDADDFDPHRFVALRDVLVESMGRDGRLPTARQLGSRLGHFRERNVGGRRFVSEVGSHDKVARWRVDEVRVLRDVAGSLVSEKNPQESTGDSSAFGDLRVLAGSDPGPSGKISEDHDHSGDHVEHTAPVIEPQPKHSPQYPQYPQYPQDTSDETAATPPHGDSHDWFPIAGPLGQGRQCRICGVQQLTQRVNAEASPYGVN